MRKRIFSVLTALALCLTLLPPTASAADAVQGGATEDAATPVTADVTRWSDGHFVVDKDVDLNDAVTVTGNAILTLEDSCTLTMNGRICINQGNSLIIKGKGTLETSEIVGSGSPLTIEGGNINIKGGGISCGPVTIIGGVVNTCGGNSNPGISVGSTVTINGGTVTASTDSSECAALRAGNIVVTGGTLTATSGKGIVGTLSTGENGHAVIYTTGTPTVDENCQAIIFSGDNGRVYGSPTLAESLTIAEGQTLTVPKGADLTLQDGVEIENRGTVRLEYGGEIGCTIGGDGERFTENISESLIVLPPPGTICYNGQDRSAAVAEAVALKETVQYNEQEYKVDGTNWTAKATAKDSNYTTYDVSFVRSDGDGTPIGPVEFTLGQSGSQFTGEGAMKPGKTEYTYGENITVTAAPSATGAAPATVSNGLDASAPTMTLFFGETQVSEPVSMGQDGLFHMTTTVKDLVTAKAGYDTPITLTAKYTGNSYLAPGQASAEITLLKKSLTATISGDLSKVYDGSKSLSIVSDAIALGGILEGDVVTVSSCTATIDSADVGTHGIQEISCALGGAASGNYTIDPTGFHAAQATITSKTVSNATGSVSKPFPYTGEAVRLSPEEVTVTFQDANGETVTIPSSEYSIVMDGDSTNAGPHTFTIQDVDGGNYTVTGTGSYTITAASIAAANVVVDGRYTYTGAAQSPAAADVHVTLNGSILTADDFTFTVTNNTNAGTATVTVTGKGNYFGTATGTFEIQSAELEAKIEGAASAVATGSYGTPLSELTVANIKAYLGENEVPGVFKLSDEQFPNVGDTGTYPATFVPSDNRGNYKGLTVPVTLSLSKADAATLSPEPGTLSVQNGRAATYQYDLSQILPDPGGSLSLGNVSSYTVKSVSFTAAEYYVESNESKASIDGSTLSLPIQAVTSDKTEKIGTVTVTVQSQNYADFYATIDVQSVNKMPVTITGVSLTGRPYNGQPLQVTGTPVAKDPAGNPVTIQGDFVYAWNADGGTAPVHAGNHTLVISVPESDPNYMGSLTLSAEITPATVKITGPTLTAYVGDEVPALSADQCGIEGLVGTDKLAAPPQLSYASDPDMTRPGTVEIQVSGAIVPTSGNYLGEIQYVPGTLTVQERAVVTPPAPPAPPKPPAEIKVTGVSLDRNSLSLSVGDRAALAATVAPENASNQNVTWSSSDAAVASVDGNGTVTALKGGTATVTATTADGKFTASCTVSVRAAEYAVRYHANGGGGTMSGDTAKDGAPFTLPGCGFTPPEGKIFDAWALGSADGGKVQAGASRTFTGDTDLYALWKDAPQVTYRVTYHANGGTGTMDGGSVPAGESSALPGCAFTAPSGKEFDCWAVGSASGPRMRPGEGYTFTADTALYAIWRDLPYNITGRVVRDGGGIGGARVQLKQGPAVLAERSTAADGSFTFESVTSGIYNVVAEKDGITVTVMKEITNSGADLTITLPDGRTNSMVEIEDDTPPVIVGKLEDLFARLDEDVYSEADRETIRLGGTVEFKMEVKKAEASGKIEDAKPAGATVGLVLNLTITKTVTTESATTSKEIKEVQALIETRIPLPPALQGKASYAVYREHQGRVDILPGSGSGERYQVSADKTFITLFARRYSTYAIAWSDTAAPVNPGPADPDPVRPGDSGGGGSSSGDSGFGVTVEKTNHGAVVSSTGNAERGETVTLTVTPDNGYTLDTISVSSVGGGAVRLTEKGSGRFTFTMPNGSVTVEASFASLTGEDPCDGGADCPSRKFTDLGGADAWYHAAIDYVVQNGLMRGGGDGLFRPDANLSRTELAQILYNHAGRPAVTSANPFADVADGAWYTNAITWAAAQGVVGGYGNGLFGPDDPITREQLAAMLYRCEQKYGNGGFTGNWMFLLDFTDREDVSEWAYEPMCWMTMNHVIEGKGGKTLDPKGKATRAEAAAMLMRYLEQDKS